MKNELALALFPLSVAVIFLVLLTGSSSGQLTKPCPIDNYDKINVTYDDVRKTLSFAIDLFKQIKTIVPRENIFFSPYSVWSALAIAYFGAENETLAQLQKVLGLGEKDKGYKTVRLLSRELNQSEGVEIQEANRAYFSDLLELKKCFQRGEFHDVHQSDFSNTKKLAMDINGFVNETTKGLIPELVKPENLGQTTFVLVNAVYFKGLWEEQFDKLSTRERDFCKTSTSCSKVEMMLRIPSEVNYVNISRLEAEAIELPYINSSMSMLLFLPWENVGNVDKIADQLDRSILGTAVKARPLTTLGIELPKFKMEQTLRSEMKEALQNIGITDLFSRAANLSAFTTTKALNVDVVIHKAVVDVTEEGTEAAAATALFDVRFGGFPPPKFITFNRPFVFLIVDKRLGLILFSGIFREPPL